MGGYRQLMLTAELEKFVQIGAFEDLLGLKVGWDRGCRQR